MLREDKKVTREKSSSFSGYRKQNASSLCRERTSKTKRREVRLCARALLSRVEIISAVLIRLTSGLDSSLLAILSVIRSFAKKLFLSPLLFLFPYFPSQSLSYTMCSCPDFPHFSCKKINYVYMIRYTVLSPLIDKHDIREHTSSNGYIGNKGRCGALWDRSKAVLQSLRHWIDAKSA